ncbi:class I tRNA ligase family protein, partial [candidate division NPL-UPA2 bacterium]|nr:class I tRNA ligase family protein [candidate division NPL-UPA2 bacterium]
LNEERVEGMRNFANKLWNASRFILLNTKDFQFRQVKQKELRLDEDDEYIISRVNQVIKEMTDSLSACRFCEASQVIYEFLWHEFCDWYVELSKLRLYDSGATEEDKRTARWVLHYVLRNVLKLLHPYMPFITEEIWQHLAAEEGSIMVSSWPRFRRAKVNEEAMQRTRKKYEVIIAERRIRSSWNISPGRKLEHIVKPVNGEEKEVLEKNRGKLIKMLSSIRLTIDESYEPTGRLGSEVTPSGTAIFVNLGEGLDIGKEIERREKEIVKIKKELKRLEKKLNSSDFLDKAPREIVQKERSKKKEYETRRSRLTENLEKIK